MPTYTYVCGSCGSEVEKRQSFSDSPLTTCESCSGALRRVFHPVGVIFKGSGFYNTDYKKSTNGGSKTDGSASESGDGNKSTSGEKSEGATAAAPKSESSASTPSSSSNSSSSSSSESKASAAGSSKSSKD